MAVNRYSTSTVFAPQLYTPPLEYVEKALKNAQQEYDRNFMAAQALKNKYIDSLDADRPAADRIQLGVEKKIDNIVAQYDGDYSQATKDLYLLTSEIERMYRPGGEAYAIATNKSQYDAAVKREMDRLAKGEITQKQFDALFSSIKRDYKGVQKDPKTGSYTTLNIEPLAQFVDEDAIFKTVEQQVPWRKRREVEQVQGPDGMITLQTVEREYRDPTELANAFGTALLNNDKYLAYSSQLARLSGVPVQDVLAATISEYQQGVIPAVSGNKSLLQEIDMKEDPVARDMRKFSYDMELERLKQRHRLELKKAEEDAETGGEGGNLSILTYTAGPQFDTIDPDKIVGQRVGMRGFSFQRAGVPDVNQLIASGKGNYNFELLKALKAQMKGRPDSDVIAAYNNTVTSSDNYGNVNYYYRLNTQPARLEEANNALARMFTGQVAVKKVDVKTGKVSDISGTEVRKLAQGWYDPESKTAIIGALGKSSPSSGNLPYGTVMPGIGEDNSYYIIEENDVAFNKFNKDVAPAAFGWIQEPQQLVSDPFTINRNGRTEVVMGVKEYVYDRTSNRATRDIRYVAAERGPNGKYAPRQLRDKNGNTSYDYYMDADDNGNVHYWGPFDVEMKLLPWDVRRTTMPRNKVSASSKGNTYYEIP